MHAVVMAAGEGRRLRPVTERWSKAVLPIDGRPVVASLLRELAAAGVLRVWLVTGYRSEQVEALVGTGEAFGVDVRPVSQPAVLGSADAVARAVAAGARPPVLVSASDTLFKAGDVASFVREFAAAHADGAIAVRRDPPPGSSRSAVRVSAGLVERVQDDAAGNPLSGAPLWALDRSVLDQLCVDREPYELASAFQAAIDKGARILSIEIGKTRDLTDPLDLVMENFPYLRQ
jgi:NDP-sugar pyrophosphorylase family protein